MSGTDKTDAFLLTLFDVSHKRESDLDEAIWRSMPFFAAALGLAVAIIPSVYQQVLAEPRSPWRTVAGMLLTGAVLSFLWAGRWFWRVIRIRRYRYPPPDDRVLAYANELEAYHTALQDEASGDDRDTAVRDELRQFMIEEVSSSNTQNRLNNADKAVARSQALLFIVIGFAVAFLAEATMLMAAANPAIRTASQGTSDDIATKAASPPLAQGGGVAGKTGTAEASDRVRGRELLPVARAVERAGGVNELDEAARSPSPPESRRQLPVKPERPMPEYLKKSDDPRDRR